MINLFDFDFLQALQGILSNNDLWATLIKLAIPLAVFLWLVRNIWQSLTWLIDRFRPYNPEVEQRIQNRQLFADHILGRMERLNRQEDWKDRRYADLEAEVEADANWRTPGLLRLFRRTSSGLRREPSLAAALERAQDKVILLEGDPGSGKSVSLRHLAEMLAERAKKRRNPKTIIPIYINLKGLERQPGEPVDKRLIENFILETLHEAADRDVEVFIDDEYLRGLREGTWLFLFDSFDELPEVLSATDDSHIIRSYSDALADFLQLPNKCRGIIASRQFKSPVDADWPRFRILELSDAHRLELIKKMRLDKAQVNELLSELAIASPEMRQMAGNPMLLALLCEHVKGGYTFPQNTHTVFETYITNRLQRDSIRLMRKYGLEAGLLRTVAENVAFCMTAVTKLGLKPTREQLRDAMQQQALPIPNELESYLDALEFIKLAKQEEVTTPGGQKPFTFAHRRFQEYFATCVVLREPDRVSLDSLLLNARWRETAVVLCQTHTSSVLPPLIQRADELLHEMIGSIPNVSSFDLTTLVEKGEEETAKSEDQPIPQAPSRFNWPQYSIHLLSLLQSAFSVRLQELPLSIREDAARMLVCATKTGLIKDKLIALEIAGVVPTPVLLWMVRDAFDSRSRLRNNVAYLQVARLDTLPADIVTNIRQELCAMTFEGRISRDYQATQAHLARLQAGFNFPLTGDLLRWLRPADFLLCFLSAAVIVAMVYDSRTIGSSGIFMFPPIVMFPTIFMFPLLLILIGYILFSTFWSRTLRTELSTSRAFLNRLIAVMTLFALTNPSVLFRAGLSSIAWYCILLWTPITLLGARYGKVTERPLWLFLIFWPVIEFLTNLPNLLRRLRQKPKIVLWILGTAIGVLALVIVLVLALRFVLALLFDYVESWILFSILSLIVGGMLLSGIISVVPYIRGRLSLWIWMRQNRSPITGAQFMEEYTRFSSMNLAVRFVRNIREDRLLIASDETLQLVEGLCIEMELQPWRLARKATEQETENTNKSSLTASESNAPLSSTPPATYSLPQMAYVPAELLDELYLLTEQIRSQYSLLMNPNTTNSIQPEKKTA